MPNTILQGVVGSVAYGLAHEGSDVDRLGVYVAPFEDVLGLRHDKVVDKTLVDKAPDPDKSLHEVAKYLSLALQCNPTILELLFLPDYEVQTHTGKMIVAARDKFLSAPAVRARYGGYATAQAERLMRRLNEDVSWLSAQSSDRNVPSEQRVTKAARHCARLLLQGAQLLRDGRIDVNVSRHREYLFDLGRLVLRDVDAFYDKFLSLRANLDMIDSPLPGKPDVQFTQDLLVSIRLIEADGFLMNEGWIRP